MDKSFGNIVPRSLDLTESELTEIKHALFYSDNCHHGTTGHNQLMLIAKLARCVGFKSYAEFSFTCFPDEANVAEPIDYSGYKVNNRLVGDMSQQELVEAVKLFSPEATSEALRRCIKLIAGS